MKNNKKLGDGTLNAVAQRPQSNAERIMVNFSNNSFGIPGVAKDSVMSIPVGFQLTNKHHTCGGCNLHSAADVRFDDGISCVLAISY